MTSDCLCDTSLAEHPWGRWH